MAESALDQQHDPRPVRHCRPGVHTATYQNFDERLTFFYSAFSTSDAMFLAMPGKGAQYAGAFFDAYGERPTGENHYTLHLPAGMPVVNYWSLVLYDATPAACSTTVDSPHWHLTRTSSPAPTVRRSCISARNRPPAVNRTGSKLCRAGGGSRRCVCTDPPRTHLAFGDLVGRVRTRRLAATTRIPVLKINIVDSRGVTALT
ncbi:DUF1214 domain-containing protein [Nocardia sp. NPDC055002]